MKDKKFNPVDYLLHFPAEYAKLKAAYKDAAEEKKSSFSVLNSEFDTRYAKYLIEYIDDKIKSK